MKFVKVTRAERKAIPKHHVRWESELKGLEKLVREIAALEEIEGKVWADSMARYAKERIAVLKANPPTPYQSRKK